VRTTILLFRSTYRMDLRPAVGKRGPLSARFTAITAPHCEIAPAAWRAALAELYSASGESIVQSGSSDVHYYYDPETCVVVGQYTMHGAVQSCGVAYHCRAANWPDVESAPPVLAGGRILSQGELLGRAAAICYRAVPPAATRPVAFTRTKIGERRTAGADMMTSSALRPFAGRVTCVVTS
jgi:hypothetical protein